MTRGTIIRRAVILGLALVLSLGAAAPGIPTYADDASVNVSTYDELVNAVANKNKKIVITADIPMGGTITIDYDCTVKSADGNRFGLLRADGTTGALVVIEKGQNDSSVTVTMENIRIDGQNKKAVDPLIAVKEDTRFNLNSCVVENNYNEGGRGRQYDGGGLFCMDAFLNISDSKICNNFYTKRGGGIYSENSAMNVIRTEVVNNKCDVEGGGIYCDTYKNILIQESKINENQSDDGGGMYIANGWYGDAEAPVEITDSQINSNTAVDYGGGLIFEATIVNLNGKSTVSYNKAGRGGGGVYSAAGDEDDCQLIMNDESSVSFNEAKGSGGGVHLDEIYLIMNDKSSIHDNTSGENGGGVYAGCYGMTQNGGTIYNNHAEKYGGGVCVRDDSSFLNGGVSGMYDNTAELGGDDLYNRWDLKELYAVQKSRKYGDGKSKELGTVLLSLIPEYGDESALTEVSVPYYGWFKDNEDERYKSIAESDSQLICERNNNTEFLTGGNNNEGVKAIWSGLLLAYDANYNGAGHVYDSSAYKVYDNVKLSDYASKFSKSRPGYEFIGWNTKADGSGQSFKPGDSVKMTKAWPYTPSGKRSLYHRLQTHLRCLLQVIRQMSSSGSL